MLSQKDVDRCRRVNCKLPQVEAIETNGAGALLESSQTASTISIHIQLNPRNAVGPAAFISSLGVLIAPVALSGSPYSCKQNEVDCVSEWKTTHPVASSVEFASMSLRSVTILIRQKRSQSPINLHFNVVPVVSGAISQGLQLLLELRQLCAAFLLQSFCL